MPFKCVGFNRYRWHDYAGNQDVVAPSPTTEQQARRYIPQTEEAQAMFTQFLSMKLGLLWTLETTILTLERPGRFG